MTIPACHQRLVCRPARQQAALVVAAMIDAQLQDGQPMSGMGNVREGGMEDDGWAWLGNRTFRAGCLKPLILCMIPVSVQHGGACV